jgi:hypothetical protein
VRDAGAGKKIRCERAGQRPGKVAARKRVSTRVIGHAGPWFRNLSIVA